MEIATYRRFYPGDSLAEIRAMPWHLFKLMLGIAFGNLPEYGDVGDTGEDVITSMQAWQRKHSAPKLPKWRQRFNDAHRDS